MTTVTVWLLVSISMSYGFQTQVVERFPNEAQCEAARTIIRTKSPAISPTLLCVQAIIVKETK